MSSSASKLYEPLPLSPMPKRQDLGAGPKSGMLRYCVLLTAFVCMTLIMANSVVFQFTIICQDPDPPQGANVTVEKTYTPTEKTYIFSAVSVGRILGSLICAQLVTMFGLRRIYTVFGMLSGIATVVMPFWVENAYYQMIIRVVQGFGVSCAFVAVGMVPVDWGREKDKYVFTSFLVCANQFGTFLATGSAGVFCTSSIGWPGVYYVFGCASVIAFAIFFVIYSNSPEKETTSVAPINDSHPPLKHTIPYKSMILSTPFWGLIVFALSDAIGYQMVVLFGPEYINKVLHFKIAETGMLASVPYIFSITTKFLSGFLLDKARCVSEHLRIVIYSTSALICMTLCFLLLTLLSSSVPLIATIVLGLAVVFNGLTCIGLMCGCQTVAQQFNYIMTSIVSFENSICGILLPILVQYLAPDNTATQWKSVFYCIIGALIASNVLFLLLTKVKPAKWTREREHSSKKVLDIDAVML